MNENKTIIPGTEKFIKNIKKEKIFQTDNSLFESCHASTLVELPDGRFFAAWFGGTREKDPDVAIWGAKFADNKWSSPRKLFKIRQEAHWNPVLHFEDGILYLFFKVGREIVNWETWEATSMDFGETWGEAVELVPGDKGGRGPVKNKLIVLSDGSWLAPNSIETEKEWLACTDKSLDKGSTWKMSELIPIREELKKENSCLGVIQPTLWESEPGHVHMLLRSSYGMICRSDSDDYGDTWCDVYPTELPNNNSGIDLVKMDNEKLVLLYNPVSERSRTPLSIAVSKDNGMTWSKIIDLENDPKGKFSYPAVIKTSKGLAFTYTWNRKNIIFGELLC